MENGRRNTLLIVAVIVAVLVLLRAAAPVAVEYYLNRHVLADLGDYRGRVNDVDLALWRGAFRLQDLRLDKTVGEDRVDFLIVPLVESAISWRAITRGALRAKVYIEEPQVNFVDAEEDENKQAGAGIDWEQLPEDLIRFTIEEVQIRDGEVAFRNFTSDPPVDIRATDINLTATNLTNVENEQGERVAEAELSAALFGESPWSAKASFDPFDFRDFTFASDLTISDLTRLNEFTRAYANLDLKSGHGELVMELEAEDGTLTGYVKPLLQDLDVLDWEQDVERSDKNVFQLAWEGLAGLTDVIFNNPETDKLATRIEISGDISDTNVDVFSAVTAVLRNAFVEAINANFDQLTPLTGGDDEDGEGESEGDGNSDSGDSDGGDSDSDNGSPAEGDGEGEGSEENGQSEND